MRITRIITTLLIGVLLILSACGTPAPTTPTTPAPTTPAPTTPAPATPAPATPAPATPAPATPAPATPAPATPTPAPTTPTGPGPNEVWIPRVVGAGREFKPSAITVPVGTTVTWTNKDIDEHTVTFDSGLLDMRLLGGASFSHTFTERDIFRYYCEIWSHEGMIGVVVVE